MSSDTGWFGMDWDGDGKVDFLDDMMTISAIEEIEKADEAPEEREERELRETSAYVRRMKRREAREELLRQGAGDAEHTEKSGAERAGIVIFLLLMLAWQIWIWTH